MKITYAGRCDIGKKRQVNQDAIVMFSSGECGIFCVADGMGGYSDGEKASRIIIQEITEWWSKFSASKYDDEFQKMISSLKQMVEKANRTIYQKYNVSSICGTTAVILFIYQNRYGILYAGDSRAYLFQNRKFLQLTMDEVWENQSGLSSEERNNKRHPNRGRLYNAVGIRENVQCRIITDYLMPNSLFLLCTDGLYKMCSEHNIKKNIKKCRDNKKIELISQKMLAEVYQNGARDNISMIIISCKE